MPAFHVRFHVCAACFPKRHVHKKPFHSSWYEVWDVFRTNLAALAEGLTTNCAGDYNSGLHRVSRLSVTKNPCEEEFFESKIFVNKVLKSSPAGRGAPAGGLASECAGDSSRLLNHRNTVANRVVSQQQTGCTWWQGAVAGRLATKCSGNCTALRVHGRQHLHLAPRRSCWRWRRLALRSAVHEQIRTVTFKRAETPQTR